MKFHALKVLPEHFRKSWYFAKYYEVRSTLDRTFKLGDVVNLQECTKRGHYSGRSIMSRVRSITDLSKFGLKNHVVLGFSPSYWDRKSSGRGHSWEELKAILHPRKPSRKNRLTVIKFGNLVP